MNDRPLFYRSIVPLNRETHRDLRLASESLYAFAADSHLIPAVRAPTTHDKPAPLFKTDGGDADSLIERIRLVTDYAAAAKRTQAMSRLLQELKLLQPLTIQTASDSGTMSAIHGLLGVNETVLNGLSDSNFLRLRTEGYLGSIYMHLVSLRAIDRLPRQVE